MATAPRPNAKVVPMDEAAAAPPARKNPKRKLLLIVGGLLLVAGGAGGAYFFLQDTGSATSTGEIRYTPAPPPVFAALEPFTVNLQPEAGEQYLQVAVTLQVADEKQVEMIKLYMPQVRSRILLLLASKKASELSTADGKEKLQREILETVGKPFAPNSRPPVLTAVFFTSFVIQ